MRAESIPLDKLFVSDLNARKDLQAGQEDSGIKELADSIHLRGLLSPLVVRLCSDGRHEVLIGQRRLLACQQIALDPVPCLVRDDLYDSDAVALSLIENVQRADMHPLDKARALKALYDRSGSYSHVARETTWSASTIKKYIQLLSLPEELQRKLSTVEGPARVSALAKLATYFAGDDALYVYDRISGFRQSIQEAIITRSGGDISKIDQLVQEAHEGAFDVRRCGGKYGCDVVREIIEGEMNESDFQTLVDQTAKTLGPKAPDLNLRNAARVFWKTLANA